MILFTGTLPFEKEIISLKYLRRSVLWNHWLNTKSNPNQVSELAFT